MPASGSYLTLDTPVQYIKGIGPKRAEALHTVHVYTVEDLLTYYPRRYIDRRNVAQIAHLQPGDTVTVVGKVFSGSIQKGKTPRFVLIVGDDTGLLECVWFQGLQYIAKAFRYGEIVAFSGKVSFYRGPQLIHPEYDKLSEEGEKNPLHTGGIIPLYPSSESLSRIGLDSRGFRRIMRNLLEILPGHLEDPLPSEIRNRCQLLHLSEAFENIHFPKDWETLRLAQRRLKFDELFSMQLFLGLERQTRMEEKKGIVFERVGELTKRLIEKLPFELTSAQKRVLHEIRNDMRSSKPMNRLIQGDVGSGKTIVALIAMVIAVENGYQTALMAPTEILAEQHYLSIHSLIDSLGIKIALLKGNQRTGERKKILSGLEDGSIPMVVGTHALIQEGVCFKNLGLVVIDEQHRFGVLQRAELRQKGYYPDVLVMTATPIPRTLALTLYGDLDVSVIDELPKGRKPVRTVWRTEEKRPAIYEFIRTELKKGRQAYVVYPLIEESEKIDLAAAKQGYEMLSKSVFPEFRCALLHGRMKSEEKEKVMQEFKTGEVQVLVTTTVIEVGIDVPNATIMLVEHAERFGLTQLHQLRGRVGRGTEASICILLSDRNLSEEAIQRLKTMEKTNDGFKIAEVDLAMRGPGELFGTKQSGLLRLKIADLVTDGPILTLARKEAQTLLQKDPKLHQPEHHPILQFVKKQYKEKWGLIEVG